MNRYTLLYYPGFHPDPIWLRRILLLADDLARIVPTDVPTQDSADLLALQDAIPECLRSITPNAHDIAIDEYQMPRLRKAFAFLARPRKGRATNEIKITIAKGGGMSIEGYMFLHNAKVSPQIYEELHKHRLIIAGLEKSLDFGGFLIVDENASNLILSGVAEAISRRTGLDTVTDKSGPFAMNSLNTLGVTRPMMSKSNPEGILLCSLASVFIPLEVASLNPRDYRELRDAFSSVRLAFKELTAELARINRLHMVQDPRYLRDRAKETALDFFREYQEFRKSRYARSFKKWAPLYIGGILSMIAKAVSSHMLALEISGASVGIQIIQKSLEHPEVHPGNRRVFNMLAGIRKDILRRSGIKQII